VPRVAGADRPGEAIQPFGSERLTEKGIPCRLADGLRNWTDWHRLRVPPFWTDILTDAHLKASVKGVDVGGRCWYYGIGTLFSLLLEAGPGSLAGRY